MAADGAHGSPDAWWQGVRDALACSESMVVALDGRGAIRAAGPFVAHRLGDTDGQGVIGEAALGFVAPAERGLAREAFRAATAGEEWRGPLRLVSARGVERLLKLHMKPLRTGAGELRGALVELDPAASGDGISRERLDAQSRMAGGLAHSFNNLLTVIRGDTYMLARELPEGSPLQEVVREIDESANKAAGWARQLGAIGKTLVFHATPADPGALAREGLEFLVTTAPPSVRTHLATAPHLPTVLVDEARVGQALRALLRNAVEATPEGGEISMRVETEDIGPGRQGLSGPLTPGAYVVFSIRDTGHGIPPEVQQQILQPYFTTRGPARGIGLGLPTAAAIARTSGGDLQIDSRPGQGTTVRLLVPVAQSAAPDGVSDAAVVDRRGLRTGGSRAVVLVVEDDADVLRTVRATLTRGGLRAVEARGAQHARRLLSTPGLHFDAVLADVLLPDGRGDDLVPEIRAARPHIPIVLTSGFVNHVPLNLERDDKTRFLRKPFSPAVLLRTLRETLADT